MKIDLHAHSTCSDGTQSPAELVAQAAAEGIDVLALTDHDTTDGWAQASAAAGRYAVTLVPGIEISTVRDGASLHLLAYGHDPRYGPLSTELEKARASRQNRARAIVDRIGGVYPLDWDDVLAQVPPGATIGRPHIADALVGAGHFPDRDAAFEAVLYTGSPYHVAHYAPDVADAVELVLAAGGVPVLAHPRAARQRNRFDAVLLAELVERGLGGLEVDHPDHDGAARRELGESARRHGLIRTGSSDYHGAGKTNRFGQDLTEPGQWRKLAHLLS